MLPTVTHEINGVPYTFYADDRLGEFREVHTPHIPFSLTDMVVFINNPDDRLDEIDRCIQEQEPEESTYEKRYLNGEKCCPECGYPDIEFCGNLEDCTGYQYLRQKRECANCRLIWTDTFKLISIEREN